MLILDCHDVEQTYSSLLTILDLSRCEIDDFINSFNSEEAPEINPEHQANYVFERLKEQMAIKTKYDATCWFHLTRLPAGIDFSKGLQPLREALPDILDWLERMVDHRVSQDSWQTFKTAVTEGKIDIGMLKHRHNFSQQQGPFGWLVRDFAFHPSPKRDYFRRLPEAIEDLIAAIRSRFGVDLTSTYREHSNSFIVKFQTPDSAESNLSAALHYLLTSRRRGSLTNQCTTHCSMYGQQIPPNDILEVEEFSDPPPIGP